ncbi:MAG TPA: hybrid sensor histidine kinase/response regulator, partial [Desulfobacterales bacterium]|nr:hybrid sensor histidine kinase/response regulator [Desulfobacterales bacterium]
MAMIDDEETLLAFVEESKEHMDGIETDLLTIEENGADIDSELVNKVFRAVHSIKGGAGFLGLDNVKEVAHAGENLLNLVRNGELIPTPKMITVLLEGFDLLNSMLNSPATSNEVDISEQISALKNALDPSRSKEEKTSATKEISLGTLETPNLFTLDSLDVALNLKGGNNLYILIYDLIEDIEKKNRTPMEVVNELQQTGDIVDSKVNTEAVGKLEDDPNERRVPFYVLFATIMEGDILSSFVGLDDSSIHPISSESLTLPQPREQLPVQEETPPASIETASEPAAPTSAPPAKPAVKDIAKKKKPASVKPMVKDSSLRVNVKILDNLMTLAGELVLTRNQLVQAVSSRNQQGIDTVSQRLNMVTSELQESIMSTRMQPIGNIFNKFKRVVRDLSKSLSKEINLIIEGEEVELDKTI